MSNCYNALPEGYILKETINMKVSKYFWILNIGTLVLFVPFLIIMYFFDYSIRINDGFQFFFTLLAVIFATILTIIVHELLHGIFFKVFIKGKLKFGFHGFAASCGMPNAYFLKRPFLIIGLAPFVILNPIFAVFSVIFYNTNIFLIFYLPLAMNFSGCFGDLYVAFKLCVCPKQHLLMIAE